MSVQFLHAMIRVGDLPAAVRFFCEGLGLEEIRRTDHPQGKFTLVFLAAPEDIARFGGKPEGRLPPGLPMVELTHNWGEADYAGGRNFGHLAYRVSDIYATCARFQKLDVAINRPPRDGHMAFVRSPDGISIELLQDGEALAPAEPWASMQNVGSW